MAHASLPARPPDPGWLYESQSMSQDQELHVRLTDAGRQLDELAAVIGRGAAALAAAVRKIEAAGDLYEAVDPACLDDGHGGGLRPWLAGLTALADSGRGGEALAGLNAWQELADHTAAAAVEVLAANQRPLVLRGELRGRLEAFQAKAGRRHLVEDEELSPLHARAFRLLHTAPTNLELAGAAVDAYIAAVNARLGQGGGQPW
jgi:hypothetical protein